MAVTVHRDGDAGVAQVNPLGCAPSDINNDAVVCLRS